MVLNSDCGSVGRASCAMTEGSALQPPPILVCHWAGHLGGSQAGGLIKTEANNRCHDGGKYFVTRKSRCVSVSAQAVRTALRRVVTKAAIAMIKYKVQFVSKKKRNQICS